MSQLLNIVKTLIKDMDNDWTPYLDDCLLFDGVKPVYMIGLPLRVANTVLAFVVLAYDNDSKWIDLSKDRIEDKEKIMLRLSEGQQHNAYVEAIYGGNEAIEIIKNWFIEYQKDWRWKSIITSFDYHSSAIQKCRSTMDDTASEILKKGEVLQQAVEIRKEGDALLMEIKRDFVTLDTVLDKEKREKVTSVNIMSHEAFISRLRKAE